MYCIVLYKSAILVQVLDGMSMDDAWSETSLKLVDAARAHCLYCILDTFAQICASIQDAAVRDVMSQLCAVFGLAHIRDQVTATLMSEAHSSLHLDGT